MEQIDLKKLNIAIEYTRRMTEGKNPVNNQFLEEESSLKDANVLRCMNFVEDVLIKIRDNNGYIGRIPKSVKFPYEVLGNFQYTADVGISIFVEQINKLAGNERGKKILAGDVTKALRRKGYLMEEENKAFENTHLVPTQKGREIGIYTEEKISAKGNSYLRVLYNEQAQKFLIENLQTLL